MPKPQKIIQALMVLVLITGLLTPAALQVAARPAKVQAALAQAVAAAPAEMVRVIVQKAGTDARAEALVARLGGEVLKEFDFINAFAAEVPGQAVAKLGQHASVNWVALDAPMVPAANPANPPPLPVVTVRDEFNTRSFSNNDGTVDWASNWIDTGDNSGPYYWAITVEVDNCPDVASQCIDFWSDADLGATIRRAVNLENAVAATLTFDYRLSDDDSSYVLEVSADGGSSWTILQTFTAIANTTASHDLAPYLSADTQIRFRLVDREWWNWAHLYIDNVQIEATLKGNTYQETLEIDQLQAEGLTGQGVTVAVIDSGVANHPDFTGRLHYISGFGTGDPYGHGTHVAGIIGGDGSASNGAYAGVAPGVHLLSMGVTDATGMAYESDVVDALQWVYAHNATYNIRVVNLSLNSTAEDSYHNSALDAAAEMLWFKGVVVVASAGNSGINGTFNTAKTAPANDPFILVVGASDEYDTPARADDVITNFTAYAASLDGHTRPDLIAPGYNLFAPLSPASTWDTSYPERIVFNGQYIRLSGTSMAAPTVAGVVALLLEDEPTLTPDQVKYRLLNTGSSLSVGGTSYPYLDAHAAIHGTSTAEANNGLMPHQILAKMALMAYWAQENGGENIDWGAVNWDSVNWDSVNWDSVNWDSVNWDSVNWDSVNWDSVNWDSVNWDSVNWDSVNWDSVNWDSVNWDSVNWDSVNWNSGFGSTTFNGLIAKFGPDDAARAVKEVQTDGLFWGELDRDQTTTCQTLVVEKGTTPLTVCPVETVLEK